MKIQYCSFSILSMDLIWYLGNSIGKNQNKTDLIRRNLYVLKVIHIHVSGTFFLYQIDIQLTQKLYAYMYLDTDIWGIRLHTAESWT